MVEEVGVSILGKLAGLLVDPIVRECCCLFQYRSNIENLKNELDKIKARREGVKYQVDAAGWSGGIVDPIMILWANRVDVIEKEATTVIGRTSNVDKKCYNMWCPNVKRRYLISRNAVKLNRGIAKLEREGSSFPKPIHLAPPSGILTAMTAEDKLQELATRIDYTPYVESTEGILSRESAFKEVIDALKDDSIGMIGISGMGGVGKTTFVNEVCQKAREQQLCEHLTMAAVSKKQDLFQIQNELAAMLGLEFTGENSIMTRAYHLRRRLTNGKKILVIIDDVWNAIPLKQVGIPEKNDRGGCKVIFTSRDEQVFCDMGTQLNVTVKPLTYPEALHLFQSNIGDCDGDLAKQIVDRCKGIPIAIVTVAKALVKREEAAWNYALDQLKESTGIDIDSVDKDPAYNSVKLSYDLLNDNEAKTLLFICCLFPEDANIPRETLVRFYTFPDIKERRRKVFNLVGTLESYMLLGEGKFLDTVKVHDIVRDACLSSEGLESFGYKTRKSTVEELWDALNDDKIHTIGLHGMAGVGKTTIVHNLRKEIRNVGLFDELAIATHTQEGGKFGVQAHLGQMFGLISGDTPNTRASTLHKRLSRGNRTLVIIDNVWERLDLEEIGVPNRGCKVIIVSREEKVCREMGMQKIIELGLLSDEEAWDLFQKEAGLKVNTDDEFYSVGRSVVREFGCLPLALVQIGSKLRNKDISAWKDALSRFRESATATIMQNDLKDPEAKLLLLLCCIMGANIDIPIPRLVKCISRMQLFGSGLNNEETRIKVHHLVNLLATYSLLTIEYHRHKSLKELPSSLGTKQGIAVEELSSSPTTFVLDLKTDKDVTVGVNYAVRQMFLSLPPS